MTLAKGFKDEVRQGMDVFDANNEKVGTLAESVEGYWVGGGFSRDDWERWREERSRPGTT
jgi:hypothetical protein